MDWAVYHRHAATKNYSVVRNEGSMGGSKFDATDSVDVKSGAERASVDKQTARQKQKPRRRELGSFDNTAWIGQAGLEPATKGL